MPTSSEPSLTRPSGFAVRSNTFLTVIDGVLHNVILLEIISY